MLPLRSRVVQVIVAVLAAFVASAHVRAQAPIPNRPDGYPSGPYGAPVVIDAFVDLLCPDSAAAWPTFLQVLEHYDGQVQGLLHTFPLPFHTNAFFANQGAHVVAHATNNNVTAVYTYATALFLPQAQWYNAATVNLTITEVQASLAKWVESIGVVSSSVFLAGLADTDINEEQRVSWKYACSRGILATPSFLINGVAVSADPSWTLADWESVIDPLLQSSLLRSKIFAPLEPNVLAQIANAHSAASPFVRANETCPSGETLCEYVPNKYECCLAGEACIKNVGCRCLDQEDAPQIVSLI